MSVLIKGMEMPTKCVSCDLRAFNGIMDECRAMRRKMCGFEYQKGFPEWCPLVEVKTPHGRLIDAKDLSDRVLKWLPPDPCGKEELEYPIEADICVSLMMDIDESETIIESEGVVT